MVILYYKKRIPKEMTNNRRLNSNNNMQLPRDEALPRDHGPANVPHSRGEALAPAGDPESFVSSSASKWEFLKRGPPLLVYRNVENVGVSGI